MREENKSLLVACTEASYAQMLVNYLVEEGFALRVCLYTDPDLFLMDLEALPVSDGEAVSGADDEEKNRLRHPKGGLRWRAAVLDAAMMKEVADAGLWQRLLDAAGMPGRLDIGAEEEEIPEEAAKCPVFWGLGSASDLSRRLQTWCCRTEKAEPKETVRRFQMERTKAAERLLTDPNLAGRVYSAAELMPGPDTGAEGQLWLFVSPACHDLVSVLAMCLGNQLTERGEVILVDARQDSDLEALIRAKEAPSLTDAIYLLQANPAALDECLVRWERVRLLMPVRSPEEISQLSEEESRRLLEALLSTKATVLVLADTYGSFVTCFKEAAARCVMVRRKGAHARVLEDRCREYFTRRHPDLFVDEVILPVGAGTLPMALWPAAAAGDSQLIAFVRERFLEQPENRRA